MEELQKAIDRWNRAMDQMEKWIAFGEACQALGGIVSGFVCPFSQSSSTPTIEEQQVYITQWTNEYLS